MKMRENQWNLGRILSVNNFHFFYPIILLKGDLNNYSTFLHRLERK